MHTARQLRVGVMLRHLDDPGGIRVLSVHIARYIAERMPDVDAHFLYSDASQREWFDNLPVRHVVLPARSKLVWDQHRVPAYARRAGLDIILNTKFSMPLFTSAQTVAVLPGAEQWVVPALFPALDRLYSRFVQPLLLRSTAAIITHTEQGRRDIAQHIGVDPHRIAVVPLGADAHMRQASLAAQQRIRAKYHLPRRFILFLGGLSSLKNGHNLVRAFASVARALPDIDLVFAGFRKHAAHGVFDTVESLGLQSRVYEPGYIDDVDLPALYSAAECLAFPSWYEGFGIPIVEAMACQCPVVTSTAGCAPEVAGGAAVLVPPEDPTAIAAGIRRVIEDPAVRRRCMERGLERSAHFTWETTGRLVGELLRTLGRRQPAHPGWDTLRRFAQRVSSLALWCCALDWILTLATSTS